MIFKKLILWSENPSAFFSLPSAVELVRFDARAKAELREWASCVVIVGLASEEVVLLSAQYMCVGPCLLPPPTHVCTKVNKNSGACLLGTTGKGTHVSMYACAAWLLSLSLPQSVVRSASWSESKVAHLCYSATAASVHVRNILDWY